MNYTQNIKLLDCQNANIIKSQINSRISRKKPHKISFKNKKRRKILRLFNYEKI